MKMRTFVMLLALITVGGAVAAAPAIFTTPIQAKAGVWILPQSLNAYTAAEKLTRAPGCDLDYDFPALGPDGKVGGGASTWAKTCTGARVGDACTVGSNAYADGGVPVDVLLNCLVTATDTVVVHAHSLVNDAGVLNPVDAGYHVRLFSNQ